MIRRMWMMTLFAAALALPLRAQDARWRVFADYGPNYPLANFTYDVNGAGSVNAGIERVFRPVSLELVLGKHEFDGDPGASRFARDAEANQLSVNAKKFFGTARLQPFVNLGVGVYGFDPGTEKFGANGGGGVLWRITPRWGVEGAYNYHTADEAEFSTVQAGVRVSF